MLSEENLTLHVSRASSADVKLALKERTQEIIEWGAFGAPSMLVTNAEGKTEFFFGSDRWEHVADFLGKKWQGSQPNTAARL